MDISEKFNYYRKAHKMTFRQVSKKTGLSIGHLCNIEKGEIKSVKLGTLKKIAECFGMDPSEWVTSDSDEEWIRIMKEARDAGISITEVKSLIRFKKWEQKNNNATSM